MGVLVSVFIIKAGIDLIKDSVDNVLGLRIESKLAKSIKAEILKEKKVEGVFDLILNDYGPDTYLGSAHIEVPDTLTATEIDKISRSITKRVQKKYGVILHTIGVYSINRHDAEIVKAHKNIRKIVFSHDGILQMHGFYLDKDDMTINLDIIIDFAVENRIEFLPCRKCQRKRQTFPGAQHNAIQFRTGVNQPIQGLCIRKFRNNLPMPFAFKAPERLL